MRAALVCLARFGCTVELTGAMEFRLLGPLEVVDGDRRLTLGGVKPRSLLAMLLLHANEVVSADRLIDELWGDEAPATAAKSIQVYVSRLRKDLGEGRLATRAPGYVLNVDPSEFDLARFEQLVLEADGASTEHRAAKLREALSLWRGAPLADLAYEQFAQTDIARLEEMRLAALERRIDADLARGAHATLAGELEAAIAAHPLRERLRWQLMLVLYRSARQADALEAYNRARHDLSEQLGLEPGEDLRRLQQAILKHDPALDLPPAEPAAANGHPGRSILLVPDTLEGLAPLLSLGRPLATSSTPHELIVAAVVDRAELAAATATLAGRREALLVDGLAVRTAAFASPSPAEDVGRLAAQQDVDLLLMTAADAPLEGHSRIVLEEAPCDVGLFVPASGPLGTGPIIVPFGAGWHDWAALELGAWVARATGAPLRLVGSASDPRHEGRDASRLLADASLIVQAVAGVVAEPLLASPGRSGVAALAQGAGLLVVGLSERWRQEGLGTTRAELLATPRAPTVFVRRGSRPGGLAPADTRTRFGWSLTASAA
jgi:DNA-binding SARP family transcriptional activator